MKEENVKRERRGGEGEGRECEEGGKRSKEEKDKREQR